MHPQVPGSPCQEYVPYVARGIPVPEFRSCRSQQVVNGRVIVLPDSFLRLTFLFFFFCRGGFGQELRNGFGSLALEQISVFDIVAQVDDAYDGLDGRHGGTSDVEEIVQDPHFFQLQDVCVDLAQVFLQFVCGGHKWLFTDQFRQGQQFAVYLAVGRQGEGLHFHESRGNHVLGESGAQVGFECRRIYLSERLHHVVPYQLLCSPEFPDIGNGRGNALVLGHHGLNLAQFNAESPQFDLAVNAAHVFQLSFRVPSYQVPGTVKDRVVFRPGVGIGNETLPGQVFPFPVTQSRLTACQAQFARYAGRQ